MDDAMSDKSKDMSKDFLDEIVHERTEKNPAFPQLVEEAAAKAKNKSNPQTCPFCAGDNTLTYMVEWAAVSSEDKLRNILYEHQCKDCAHSFWTG